MDSRQVTIISTGNEELDIKLGGGIPHPSLIIIEGAHGTGKTVLAQQFLLGALRSGFKAIVVTTETTAKGYVIKSRNAGVDLTDYYIKARLTVYSLQLPGARWTKSHASRLLPILGRFIIDSIDRYDVFVVDSLSHIAIYTTPTRVLDFFNRVRIIADKGKTIILTIHPNIVREDLVTRARAICDGYITLSTAVVGGRSVKVMKIVKLKGAHTQFESTISYDVDPAFGIKIVPIALARA
ncbi:MAG: flagellar accessory protein FlaH [Desulfurococcales archaeon]|nr:flagellar accessory protein FlaH [Desulfurococcales archaeon]